MKRIEYDVQKRETRIIELEDTKPIEEPQPQTLTPEEELKLLKKRQDETENAIMFLMDMNLMGGM